MLQERRAVSFRAVPALGPYALTQRALKTAPKIMTPSSGSNTCMLPPIR